MLKSVVMVNILGEHIEVGVLRQVNRLTVLFTLVWKEEAKSAKENGAC